MYITKKIALCAVLLLSLQVFIFAQTEETNQKEEELIDSWLISRTPPVNPDTSEEVYKEIGDNITLLLSKRIVPQSIDRNLVGELLITYQTSPPANPVMEWALKKYDSELSMMEGLEEYSIDGWSPTGFDVQQDAAFVLYLKSGELVNAARLIKVDSVKELQNSIQTYYQLGFFPAAISTFGNSLWLIFIKSVNKDISNADVIIRSGDKDTSAEILDEELGKGNTVLIDTAYTADNKVIMLFGTTTVPAPPQEKN